MNKKILLSLLLLSALLVSACNNQDLQGKFSSKPSSTTSVKTDIKSSVGSSSGSLITITNNFLGLGNFYFSKGTTTKSSFASLTMSLDKDGNYLAQCGFTFGVYHNGAWYNLNDTSSDPNHSFFSSMEAYYYDTANPSKYLGKRPAYGDLAKMDFFKSSVTGDAAFATGKAYNFVFYGVADSNSDFTGPSTSTAAETDNKGVVYLKGMSCQYTNDPTTGAVTHVWDATDSKGENGLFTLTGFETGKGIPISTIVIGN